MSSKFKFNQILFCNPGRSGKRKTGDLPAPSKRSDDTRRFLTPAERPPTLEPAGFTQRMLRSPVTLLHRALKLSDYDLCDRLLECFAKQAAKFAT